MADSGLTDRFEAARWIARAAGQLALDYFRNRDRLTVEMKGPSDYVSHADRDVENVIRRELNAAFPDDLFLGEETAAQFTIASGNASSTAAAVASSSVRSSTIFLATPSSSPA